MILFNLDDILPALIHELQPRHQEIAVYLLSLPGKRRPSFEYANRTWGMSKEQWRDELASTLTAMRDGLRRHGIYKLTDVETEQRHERR